MILVFRSKATKLACGFLLSYAVLHSSIMSLRAQTFQHFTISNIYIDASADTAIAARSIALSVGQRDAFQQLMTRLALSEYYTKLPSLDNAAIAALVQGLEIEEELSMKIREHFDEAYQNAKNDDVLIVDISIVSLKLYFFIL